MHLILSISSDIGTAIALNWLESNKKVVGTFRNWSQSCELLRSKGAHLIKCDLSDPSSINDAVSEISGFEPWEVLLLAPGDQNPIGLFRDVRFEDWEHSVNINFIKPIEFTHRILHQKSNSYGVIPSVIMFAGGGTNSATSHYSAYTIAKIASIKMIELLDHEIEDCKFSIIGPGWVESKIHNATLNVGHVAGQNFEKTLRMRTEKLMNPVEDVIEACNWVIEQPKSVVGGRNFSSVFDDFSSAELRNKLISDANFFKLRRNGNGIYER